MKPAEPSTLKTEVIDQKRETEEGNDSNTQDRNEIVPEKVLFSWQAPSRPFKRRDREFWVTTIAIAGVAALVLFLVEGYMPVMLIIALAFLFYVLSTVEPEQIDYEITNKGIKIAGRLNSWEIIGRHWFAKRYDSTLLVFEIAFLPGRLELVINSSDKSRINDLLGKYSPEEEIPPSNLDRAADWFAKKLPGN